MKDMKIVMLGLDGAGKTTILFKLKQEEAITDETTSSEYQNLHLKPNSVNVSIPTYWTAFNAESINHKDVSFDIWDIVGLDKARCLWKGYFAGKKPDGLIFVVDSTDRDRVGEARHELHKILNEDDVRECGNILVFAHKQDLAGAMSAEEFGEKLGLDGLDDHRRWCVKGTSVISLEGLYEGLDWFSSLEA